MKVDPDKVVRAHSRQASLDDPALLGRVGVMNPGAADSPDRLVAVEDHGRWAPPSRQKMWVTWWRWIPERWPRVRPSAHRGLLPRPPGGVDLQRRRDARGIDVACPDLPCDLAEVKAVEVAFDDHLSSASELKLRGSVFEAFAPTGMRPRTVIQPRSS